MCPTHIGQKIMRKTFLALVLVFGSAVSVNAQYFFNPGYGSGLGWGTEAGSPAWCMAQQQIINRQSLANTMMGIQYQQALSQQANQAYNWLQQHPFEANPYQQTSTPREKVQCGNCGGTGWIYKQRYMGNGHVITQKIRCGFCYGTGQVRH